MKRQIRILGIDDAPFTFQQKYAFIIGVVMRGGQYIECVLRSEVAIDGTDATDILTDMVRTTRHRNQLKAVMIDGIALGGFNIIDIQTFYENIQIPIITITRDKPDFQKIKTALQNNFFDWVDRWKLLHQGTLHEVTTRHNPIFVKCFGIDFDEVKEIIKLTTIRGVIPEPIRVAHLIASGITRGESYGKA